ncbi:retropepsin-like aspartic protease [uncultured Draconibacterium sp.]|uniref:retropepsin-like aspartic protease n=1 Tax=uncultured Draconibacterium sp. TaxID=1573823 RepID=UPI0025E4715B|nr:retropepsin-like aspartic protease [uncultured Draconibacterium sp.]
MRVKLPVKIVELESSNFHLLVSCCLNSGEQEYWVIDTGASRSVFDKNLTAGIAAVMDETEDLHAANMSEAPLKTSLGTLNPVSFGKFRVEAMQVALIDMDAINDLYQKVSEYKICGLLGSDFLLKYHAVIDYKRQLLKLSD